MKIVNDNPELSKTISELCKFRIFVGKKYPDIVKEFEQL